VGERSWLSTVMPKSAHSVLIYPVQHIVVRCHLPRRPPYSVRMAEQRGTISPKTRQALYAASRGFCYRPGCSEGVIAIQGALPVLVGQIAHIIAAVTAGPRGTAEVDDRDKFENLIVLCGRHHKLVDDAATCAQYPPEVLRWWKAEREAVYQEFEPGDGIARPSHRLTPGLSSFQGATEVEHGLALELLALVDPAATREDWDKFESRNQELDKRARKARIDISPTAWVYLRSSGSTLLAAVRDGRQSEILSQLTGRQAGLLRELHLVRQGSAGYLLTDIGMYTVAAAVTD
jgi:hypothetical protein